MSRRYRLSGHEGSVLYVQTPGDGERSHGGRFPNDADMWLEQAWPITADGVLGTAALDYGLYVAASQIAWIEVIEESDSRET
jgi:hypothetical protein